MQVLHVKLRQQLDQPVALAVDFQFHKIGIAAANAKMAGQFLWIDRGFEPDFGKARQTLFQVLQAVLLHQHPVLNNTHMLAHFFHLGQVVR